MVLAKNIYTAFVYVIIVVPSLIVLNSVTESLTATQSLIVNIISVLVLLGGIYFIFKGE